MPDRLRHRVNLLYPNFYLDVVEVGRYVKIQRFGPTYDGAIGKVIDILPLGVDDELYNVKFEWGASHQFYSYNIELLPADYIYHTIHEAAVRELGEDYFD